MSALAHLTDEQLAQFEAVHRQELDQSRARVKFAETLKKSALEDLVEVRQEQLRRAREAKASQ